MFIHMLPRLQQEGVCEHGEHTALICWPAYDCIDCDQGSDEIKRTRGGGYRTLSAWQWGVLTTIGACPLSFVFIMLVSCWMLVWRENHSAWFERGTNHCKYP